MTIRHERTSDGLRSVLDYRYRGKRYRPVLGYNLTPDEEADAALKIITAIHSNLGASSSSVTLASPSFAEFSARYVAYLQAKKLAALDRPLTIINRHLVPHFGVTPLNQLAMEDGLSYIAQRRAAGAAEGTLARECGVLQAILNYAVAIDVLDKNRLRLLPVPEWKSRERVATATNLFGSSEPRRIPFVASSS